MPFTFGSPDFFDEQVQRMTRAGSRSQVHVLLHSTNGNDAQEPGATECVEPFAIGGDMLWLCRLPDRLRDVVYKACEPQGEPYEPGHRQFGQLYTVALFMGPMYPGDISSWDGYGIITKFVSYSQLVHPTSIGFANSAVLYFDDTGTFTQASAGPCRGISDQAYVVPESRNWLSQEECDFIKMLWNTADLDTLPDRVARAHWSVQHAAYQYFVEVRTMLVAAGLDALVHARVAKGPKLTGAQFIQRTVQLATELGITFTTDDASGLWDHRSDVSHGRDPWQSVRDPADPKWQVPRISKNLPWVKRYLLGEEILRKTILKCLTDPQFAAKLASDDTVRAAYPLATPPGMTSKKRKRNPDSALGVLTRGALGF
jgi:hypothetical protein